MSENHISCKDCKYGDFGPNEDPCNSCFFRCNFINKRMGENSPFNSEESLKDQIRIEDSLEKGENHV